MNGMLSQRALNAGFPPSLVVWLTRPSPKIEEPKKRRLAALLSGVLLALIPLSLITAMIPFVMGTGTTTVMLVAPPGVAMLITAYALSRTRHCEWGAIQLVVTLTVGSLAAASINPGGNVAASGFAILSILISDLFFSRRATSFVAAMTLAGLIVLILEATNPETCAMLAVMLLLTCMATAVTLINGLIRQINARDRQALLAESEERHRLLIDTAFEGYYVREEGRVISASPGLETLLGYPAGKIVGMKEADLFGGAAHDQLAILIPGESYEMTARRADGTPIDVEVFHIEHRYEQRPVQVVALHDITYQKALDQLKTKFVADVTHELRTPVTTLGLYMKLLKNAPADKKEEYLEVIGSQVERLAQLSSDVFTTSSLDAKRQPEELPPIALNPLVESIVRLYEPAARAQGLALQFTSDELLPYIYGRRSELDIVVSCLLKNAIAFTDRGGILVRTRIGDLGDQCVLEVTDTGRGIEPEDLPHVFERFYRGRHESQSSLPGAGLGLTLVRQIVENHRGRVEVESQPGLGSTFRAILPSVDEGKR